jgi:hypothetical protein
MSLLIASVGSRPPRTFAPCKPQARNDADHGCTGSIECRPVMGNRRRPFCRSWTQWGRSIKQGSGGRAESWTSGSSTALPMSDAEVARELHLFGSSA